MKRVKSACILQTLVFSQNKDVELSKEDALRINREEFEHYKATLERGKIRYVIEDKRELDDGSVEIHVKKQYNRKTDVSEYFGNDKN